MMVMNLEGHESHSEQLPRLEVVANMLQISLMPLAYRARHPGAEVNMADRDLRNRVATEWAENYAQSFREYIEDHPRDTIDLGDQEALLEFFTQLASGETLH
jgi:hypothetical protein